MPDDVIVERIYAKGFWCLESPALFGGGEGPCDMNLERDVKGRPVIPGSSIAGALRSALARKYSTSADFREEIEPEGLELLFGAFGKEGSASSLIVDEASMAAFQRADVSIRDGVSISGPTRAATGGMKYDYEVIEPGCAFEMNFELLLRSSDAEGHRDQIRTWFDAMLIELQSGNVQLGARTRRGFGRGHISEWKALRRCNLSVPSGGDHERQKRDVIAWLRNEPEEAVEYDLPRAIDMSDKRNRFVAEVTFQLCGSLLIRSPQEKADAPDVMHLHSGRSKRSPVIPGSSWAGIFRHRAQRILRSCGWPQQDTEALIADVFGAPPHRKADDEVYAGRLSIEEMKVSYAEGKSETRVAIDRFTGGALDHALFDEEPIRPESKDYHGVLGICLEEPDDREIGLLLLVLRDVWMADCPIGGESSIGRGWLRGVCAKFVRQEWQEQAERKSQEKRWEWLPSEPVQTSNAVVLQQNRVIWLKAASQELQEEFTGYFSTIRNMPGASSDAN